MRIYFNDCSLKGADDATMRNQLNGLIALVKRLRGLVQEHDSLQIWASEDVLNQFYQSSFISSISSDQRGFMASMFHKEQAINGEGDVPEEIQVSFWGHSFYVRDSGNEIESSMMGWALLNNSMTIGMPRDIWKRLRHDVYTRPDDGDNVGHEVLCLTEQDQVQDEEGTPFGDWYNRTYMSEPEFTGLMPKEKKIHFRDDHGVDVLKAMAHRLIKSGYVVEIVNSLPFNSKQRTNFVEEITDDLLFHLRLIWTDTGYGMVVRTTAKNRAQAENIAQRLTERYGNP